MLMGTPKYMAPELTAGAAAAQPSADLFSFGIIAYELLTRASPFPEAPLLARLHGRPVPRPMSLEPRTTSDPGADRRADRSLSRRGRHGAAHRGQVAVAFEAAFT